MYKNSAQNTKQKIIILIGQTASGKTSTAIKLAKEIDGEIISADSRQVYKYLNIGTDKISKEGMQGTPHHLITITEPFATISQDNIFTKIFKIKKKFQAYTVNNFVHDATAAIKDIQSRGKVPIITGGTMLYIDALMGNVQVPEVPPNPALRAALEQRGSTSLFEELKDKDPRRAAQMVTEGQDTNKRRLIRALEVVAALGRVPDKNKTLIKSHMGFDESGQDVHASAKCSMTPLEHFKVLWLGLQNDPIVQKDKINKRNAQMLDNGLLGEVSALQAKGVTQEQFNTFGFEYKYPALYLTETPIIKEEPPTLAQVLMKMNSGTWRYAKKQRAWWAGRAEINWFKSSEYGEIKNIVNIFLQNK